MFRLTEEYGGKPKVRYFRTFDSAARKLPDSIFWRKDLHSIDGDHLPEKICGMKKANLIQAPGFFSIVGVPFSNDGKDEYSLDVCKAAIERVDFEPAEDETTFFEVVFLSGYADTIIYGDEPWKISLGFFHTQEEAIEEFKNDSRAKDWEIPCGPLDHTGRYLSIYYHRILN
jgi:hypothetical protein